MNNGLVKLLSMYEKEATKDKSDDSFLKIFWMQQLKALTLKSKSSIWWHPIIIRWALYLHHRSSGAYETLRKSGVLSLPSSRTLRDYQHLSQTSSPGFSTITDIQLLDMIKQAKPNHLAKYVLILIDQIYLKEGLVYNRSLIPFADLGGTLQQLSEYELLIVTTGHLQRPWWFLWSRVFLQPLISLCPVSDQTHDVFPLLWQTIDHLELNNLQVLGVTGDGASVNRKLF